MQYTVSPSLRRIGPWLQTAAARLATMSFFALVALLLWRGWQGRTESTLSAEQGIGYALGIVGGSMLLMLLLYPLRKKLQFMRRSGAVRHWFRMHMLFGVLGPVAILYHTNFQLGSLNSNVALFCMLLVASSGLLGRYFYIKIHHGLYGRQASLQELQDDSALQRDALLAGLTFVPQLQARLREFEVTALAPTCGVMHSAWRHLSTGVRGRFIHRALRRYSRRALREEARRAGWGYRERRRRWRQLERYLGAYFAALHKVTEFGVYTRLFGLWHVLHVPLFVMMLISAVVHVIAVHMY